MLDKGNAKPFLFLSRTVFFVRMRFLSARKTRLARQRAMACDDT
jgi:hypothetical protein